MHSSLDKKDLEVDIFSYFSLNQMLLHTFSIRGLYQTKTNKQTNKKKKNKKKQQQTNKQQTNNFSSWTLMLLFNHFNYISMISFGYYDEQTI